MHLYLPVRDMCPVSRNHCVLLKIKIRLGACHLGDVMNLTPSTGIIPFTFEFRLVRCALRETVFWARCAIYSGDFLNKNGTGLLHQGFLRNSRYRD